MIETYQEEVELLKESAPIKAHEFATIGDVYDDGVSLIFDDSGVESTKHYLSTFNMAFFAGDRVKVRKVSGTYVVEYAVTNAPVQEVGADFATTAQYLGAESGSSIGCFGTTPIGRQTINLASNNMGYTSVTSGNYLYALNNLIGIFKSKYGLIL